MDVKHHWINKSGAARAQKLCESRGGHPGFPVRNKLHGFCGRKAALNRSSTKPAHSSTWIEVLLYPYVHRNRSLIRDGSPGRPPRLSHSSWALNNWKADWFFCCLTSTEARRPIRDGDEWASGDRRMKPRNRRQPGRPRLPWTAARTTGC